VIRAVAALAGTMLLAQPLQPAKLTGILDNTTVSLRCSAGLQACRTRRT
jgi:hypothetical protein